jgi:ferric-dicitrate binding protein FerR (iron transport regulator)
VRISIKSDEDMSENGDKYKNNEAYSTQEWNDLLVSLRVPAIKTKDEAWQLFVASLPGKAAKTRSLKYVIYALAASVALIIGVFSFYHEKDTHIWCQPASIKTVSLPDGSQVILNAASGIDFNKRTWFSDRMVKLEGEAFFKVKKGSKFKVVTPNGKVVVLGTTFNVFARSNRLDVYCETGKVAVITTDTSFITAGSKTLARKGESGRIMKAEKHESSWQKGEFWFSNAPMGEVIAELERQFDIDIVHQDLSNRYYTGYFNTNSLKEALTMVFSPMQLQFEIKNRIIHIH